MTLNINTNVASLTAQRNLNRTTIQLDRSDLQVFHRAAEPGEWAVSGGFAFADHNHTSRSSASQTIHVLVGRGLLVRRPAPGDRRSHRLDLTEEAHVLLRKDPLQELVGSIGEMSERERFELAERLEQLLKSLMRRRLARRRAS